MNRINIHPVPFHPTLTKVQKQLEVSNTKQSNFSQIFDHYKSVEPLKISKHASERMQLRNISISEHEWDVITEKISEAKQKGVKQPLVILDQATLIVSATNNTVITALDRYEAKEQLFTNIDGTIVL